MPIQGQSLNDLSVEELEELIRQRRTRPKQLISFPPATPDKPNQAEAG